MTEENKKYHKSLVNEANRFFDDDMITEKKEIDLETKYLKKYNKKINQFAKIAKTYNFKPIPHKKSAEGSDRIELMWFKSNFGDHAEVYVENNTLYVDVQGDAHHIDEDKIEHWFKGYWWEYITAGSVIKNSLKKNKSNLQKFEQLAIKNGWKQIPNSKRKMFGGPPALPDRHEPFKGGSNHPHWAEIHSMWGKKSSGKDSDIIIVVNTEVEPQYGIWKNSNGTDPSVIKIDFQYNAGRTIHSTIPKDINSDAKWDKNIKKFDKELKNL